MTLVDTNVLFDLIDRTPWADWAEQQIEAGRLRGSVFVNDVIYSEYSVRFANSGDVDSSLAEAGLALLSIPRPALVLAGKAFLQYRRAGGTRTGVLPDFFIGAHAAASNLTLITRDPRRYRTYFPTLVVVEPGTQ